MEKEAANVSTSEEGRLEELNQYVTQNQKKRIIKKPRFHDEMEEMDDNNGK